MLWRRSRTFTLGAPLAALLTAAGCGASGTPARSPTAQAPASTTASQTGALTADATAGATGDIPDTQHFLTFQDRTLRISMLYPEGWTVRQQARALTFKDKNNLVRIHVARGAAPTVAAVRAQLVALARTDRSVKAGAPRAVRLNSGTAIKVSYTTMSAANPVTGKRVTLIVDRYELERAGRVAIVELGTPVGVDNVDAFRRMIGSFRWR